MIITCEKNIPQDAYQTLLGAIREQGLDTDILRDPVLGSPIIGVRGDCSRISIDDFAKLPGVEAVKRISVPWKHVSREYHPEDTVVDVSGVQIGAGKPIAFMAGPCSVESEEQILRIAYAVESAGAVILRGGTWKPRSFPGHFEGLKEKGLQYLREAGDATGLPIVTEVMTPEHIPIIGEYTDMFQVGSRNMQNQFLLDALGQQEKPVLLKRHYGATIDEFLGAAERVVLGGNTSVILCLRGVRTFEPNGVRFPADLYAIPLLKHLSHLPVVFDPSHSAGKRLYVPSHARMAVAGGADGLIIETHYDPAAALTDGAQTITPDTLRAIIDDPLTRVMNEERLESAR